MRYRLLSYLFLLTIAFAPLSVAASSTDYWNPFRGSNISFSDEINSLLNDVLQKIANVTKQTVSSYKIPAWKNVMDKLAGNSSVSFRDIGYKFRSSTKPVVPTPIAGEKSDDNPCGGRQTDSYWADDCSCRCSRGELPNLDYEVSDRCPENDNLACEDCKKITRHSNVYTKISQCRDNF